MTSTERALIIGGGIGGLTLAAALHKLGIAFDVYEQAPELTEVGAEAPRTRRVASASPAALAQAAPLARIPRGLRRRLFDHPRARQSGVVSALGGSGRPHLKIAASWQLKRD